MKRYQLMIPGPVTVDAEILQVLAQPQVAHYGDQWTRFYLETLELLKEVLQTKGEVFLLVGSGSAGLDATIGSLLGRSGKALPGPFCSNWGHVHGRTKHRTGRAGPAGGHPRRAY